MKSSIRSRLRRAIVGSAVLAGLPGLARSQEATPATPGSGQPTWNAPSASSVSSAPSASSVSSAPSASSAASDSSRVAAARWYDAVKLEGFVDGYASLNSNFPKPQAGQNAGRAFDVTNGFALHWAGLNASYAPAPVGATIGLRFGPGASIYNAGPDDSAGLTYVKQAFVAWKPVGGVPLQIDFGKFDTWIGAEVADSQYDMTYTRSALFATQPLFHTGLRLDYTVSDVVDVKVYAVNGSNNSVDNNAMKTFGATLGVTPSKQASLYLNYVGGPEQSDLGPPDMAGARPVVKGANSRWRHLADAVADFHFGAARVVVNADIGTEKLAAGALDPAMPAKNVTWFGGNLTLGYAVSDAFAFAVRGGYLADPDGFVAPLWGAPAGQEASIVDGSLTLAFSPTANLLIKLEPRVDSVSSDAPGWAGGFAEAPDADAPGVTKTLFTTTLGVVATTN